MSTCSILPVASALHDEAAVAAVLADLGQAIELPGVEMVSDVHDAPTTAPFAVLVLTGGTERAVLDAWWARQQLVPGEPLLLLTHPDQNSLPAALESLAHLQADGARGRIAMADPAHGLSSDLVAAVHDHAVWHALHGARIGMVGPPSDWLVASMPERACVARRWGPEIVDVDLPATLARYESTTSAPLAVPVRVGARHVHEPTEADIEAAARFEPVLRDLAASGRFDAVSVRCFDLVTDAHTSGCLALSALNDDGIIAGCEGDLPSTLGLLWARHLTGVLGWMANPAAADRTTGVIELAHCTVPRSIVSRYDLRSHFESGLGVGIAGTFRPGPVTLLRLGGRELDRLWCVDAEALTTIPREGRCRTQLDVAADPAAVSDLLDHPLGNHVVVLEGHHADQLQAWWDRMIAPVA